MIRPNSPRRPRIWLACAVRALTNPWWTRCSDRTACCSTLLTGTKRMLGRATASQIRLGVGDVVLVALDVGLDELRRHQPSVVAEALQRACPVVSAAARLHADHTGR